MGYILIIQNTLVGWYCVKCPLMSFMSIYVAVWVVFWKVKKHRGKQQHPQEIEKTYSMYTPGGFYVHLFSMFEDAPKQLLFSTFIF